jgi:hypothetical protein
MADEVIGQPAEVAAPAEVAVETPTEAPVNTQVAHEQAAAPETTVTAPEAPVKAPDWPDDWRQKAASHTVGKTEGPEYDKEVKRLQRITSPAEMYKSYRNLEAKLAQGPAAPSPFPAEGSDDEKKAWRTERGIPETPADYLKDAKFDDGLVIGEEDRPQIDAFLAEMHSTNADPKTVKTALNAYYKMREQQVQEQAQRDEQDRNSSRDTLRDEFGRDYTRYLGAVQGLLSDAPDDVRQNLLGARLGNGVALGNDPATIRWLTKLAVDINPSATVVPGGGANSAQTIDGEIAAIETRMKTDRAGYFGDKAAQDRYDELLKAREGMKRRAG